MQPISARIVLLVIGVALAMAPVDSAAERLFVLTAPYDHPAPGTIAAFDIGPDGLPVQAESYPTGGPGWSRSGPQDVVIDARSRFLFAANNEGKSIAAFAIRQDDGTLQPVPGSPFPTADLATPYFLAVTPDATFLYSTTDRGLQAFEIGGDGALDPIQTLPVSSSGLVTSRDGVHLYAVSWPDGGVHSFRISASGTLSEVVGSPFEYPDAERGWRPIVSEDGQRLWLLDLDTGIAAFDVDDRGALQFTGQTAVGDFAEAFGSALDDRYLYVGITYAPEIRGYAATGVAPVELGGSPFAAEYTALALLAARDGSRLYQVNRDVKNIASFAIAANGGLSPIGAPVPIETGDEAIASGAAYLADRLSVVAIDVKPGTDRNPIGLRGRGVIPVAILGAEDFDVFDVDQASVRFGPAAAIPAHRLPHGPEDIDGDGADDLVLHFRVEASGIACGHTTVPLVGSTFDGREFQGQDTIDVLGCSRERSRTPTEWYPAAPDDTPRSGSGVSPRRTRARSD